MHGETIKFVDWTL